MTSSRGGKKMWCVPELNAEYIERMEEVLEIYERPYNPQEPVVCLDEKPVVLHGELRAEKRARPGTLAKRDYEYKRRGGANVFCAVEAKAGRHFTHPTPNRKAPEFARMIQRLANSYPRARTIHLVLDNLNTHCRKSLDGHFGIERAKALWKRIRTIPSRDYIRVGEHKGQVEPGREALSVAAGRTGTCCLSTCNQCCPSLRPRSDLLK
jgi:hypothetical protein